MNCAGEANEEDHNHNHDHDHTHHTHGHGDPPIPTNASQSLNNHIDTSKLNVLNLANRKADVPKLFKTQDNRYETSPIFKSEFGSELIINIPFDSPVKVYSVILRTSVIESECPRAVKVFKNRPELSFEDANVRPLYEFVHPLIGIDTSHSSETRLVDDGGSFVEHHFPRRKFTNTTCLSLFLADSHDNSDHESGQLALFSVEIRGEWSGLKSAQPVSYLYESASRKQDHPNEGLAAKERNYGHLGL